MLQKYKKCKLCGRNNSYAFHQSLPLYSGLSDRPQLVLTVIKMTARKSYAKHISYRDSAHLFLKIQQQIKNVLSKEKKLRSFMARSWKL